MILILNKLTIILSVTAILLFSYLPFLYLAEFGMYKKEIFAGLVVIILLTTVLCFSVSIKGTVRKSQLVVVVLYMLFCAYVAMRSVFVLNNTQDYSIIVNIIITNTVAVVLATLCVKNKRFVIHTILCLSSIYYLFLLTSVVSSSVSFSGDSFQNVFSGIEISGGYYQNICFYLGLFTISCIYLFAPNRKAINLLLLLLMGSAVIGMFLVGGRTGFVATIGVLLFAFILYRKEKSFQCKDIIVEGICGLFAMIILVITTNYIVSFFENTVLFYRITRLITDGSENIRVLLYLQAIKLFLSNVWVFLVGGGIDSFQNLFFTNTGKANFYPHNIVLELLSEHGIIGFILFCLPIVYIIMFRIKAFGSIYGDTKEERLIFLLALYVVGIFFFTSSLGASWTLLFFIYLLLPYVPEKRYSVQTV